LTVSYLLNEQEIPFFEDIQYQTKLSELSKLIRLVQTKKLVHISQKSFPYTRDRYEYTVHNGCSYRGFRVVLHPSLCTSVLEYFHKYHPGMARMRQLMRQFVWWPGIDGDIEKHVSSCPTCLSNQSSRTNCHLSSWPDSSFFFQRVFIDICFHLDKEYLIIVDHLSNFVDVHIRSSRTSQQVVSALWKTFRYFDLPQEVVCDNGRQFISSVFREFLQKLNIELRLTPPYHSQSNGKVERAIRTFKLFINKNVSESSNLHELISMFCMVINLSPNSNGLVPCREYLSINPRILKTKILLSDKRGISETIVPQSSLGSTVVPLTLVEL
jgi:transposase InsO family protein